MPVEALTSAWSSFLSGAKNKMSQWNNAEFAAATMAACALVAMADHNLSSDESRRVAQAIQNNDLLKVFKFEDLSKQFKENVDRLKADFDMNSIDLLGKVGKLKGDPEQAKAAIRIGILVAKSSDGISDDEKKILAEICKEVKIDVNEFTAIT